MACSRHRHFFCLSLTVIGICFHFNQIDITDYISAFINRNNYRTDAGSKNSFQLFQHFIKIRIVAVKLRHTKHRRFFCVFRHAVGFFCTYRYTGFSRQSNQHIVCRSHTFIHSRGEIKQSGRIDQIDLSILPDQRSHCQRNRNLPFDLFRIKVAYGIRVQYLSQSIRCTSLKQQSLCQRSFSCAAVSS